MSEDKELFDEADIEETAVTVDDHDKKDDDEYEKYVLCAAVLRARLER